MNLRITTFKEIVQELEISENHYNYKIFTFSQKKHKHKKQINQILNILKDQSITILNLSNKSSFIQILCKSILNQKKLKLTHCQPLEKFWDESISFQTFISILQQSKIEIDKF